MKSIAEDYHRHQEILEQRRKEIIALKAEAENEDKNRKKYIAEKERELEKQLQNRQQMRQSSLSGLRAQLNDDDLTDELYNPVHLELASVDEYAPYGPTPQSRLPKAPRGRGGARGARRRGRGGR